MKEGKGGGEEAEEMEEGGGGGGGRRSVTIVERAFFEASAIHITFLYYLD